MLMQRTQFSQMEVLKNGVLQIRIEKQIVDQTTGEVKAMEYHRTVLEPGMPPDDQLGLVHGHLEEMGFPALPAEDVARIRRLTDAEHTPERVEKFRAEREAAIAASEAARGKPPKAPAP